MMDAEKKQTNDSKENIRNDLENQIESLELDIERLEFERALLTEKIKDPNDFAGVLGQQEKRVEKAIRDIFAKETKSVEPNLNRMIDRYKKQSKVWEERIKAHKAYSYRILKTILDKIELLPQEESVSQEELAFMDEVGAKFDQVEPANENKKKQPVNTTDRKNEDGEDMGSAKKDADREDPKDIKESRREEDTQAEKTETKSLSEEERSRAQDTIIKMMEGFWDDPPQTEVDEPVQNKEQTPQEATKPEAKTANDTENKQQKVQIDDRYSYIVGKIAGEDIFDKTGKLIIAKNEVITEAVIDKSEKEGKLVELVVNMRLEEDPEV